MDPQDISQSPIPEFVDANILTILDLDHLPKVQREAFVRYLSGLVVQRIKVRVAKELPQEKQELLVPLLKQDDIDGANSLAFEELVKDPDIARIVVEEVVSLKEQAQMFKQKLKATEP